MTSNEETIKDEVLICSFFIDFFSTNEDSNKNRQVKNNGIISNDKTIIYPTLEFKNVMAEKEIPKQRSKKAKPTSKAMNPFFDFIFINPSLLYVIISKNLDTKNKTKIGQ